MASNTKQALLQALSAAEGGYISGQRLAETLGVSRAAVHKAAAALAAQGYALHSAPRRGYRLTGGDPFCAEAVGSYPAPIYLYDSLESSNLTAKQLALTGAPHGTLVLTSHQQAGRGRMGRVFESPAGKGVYCSLLLRPDLSAADAQTVTIGAAVAVARAVKALCGLELSIKWVNDLYYQGRKVCGILTEAVTDFESGDIDFAVVGIGLNLYEAEGGYPSEIRNVAGALYENREAAAGLDRNRLAAEIINALLEETRELRLPPEYIQQNLVPGREIQIVDGQDIRKAKALEICPDGRLKVQESDGSLSILAYGEVSLII